MSYAVEDFEFSTDIDGAINLDCPYSQCPWYFEVATYFHGIGDLIDAAGHHLLGKHND